MVNILDSFEDGDSSEYDGAVNAFSTSTNHAFDGSYALQTDASESAISRTDIQVSYDGQIPFGARLLADELVGPDNDSNYPLKTIDFFFAVQTAGEQYNGSYVISTNFDTEELSIGVYDSDANLTELGVTSVTAYEADVWYEVAVTQWTTAGDITVEVRDENGSTLGTISVNDDSYSKGGIGWGVGENFSSAQVWYDYAYEVVSLERNSTLSTDSSITSKRASSKNRYSKITADGGIENVEQSLKQRSWNTSSDGSFDNSRVADKDRQGSLESDATVDNLLEFLAVFPTELTYGYLEWDYIHEYNGFVSEWMYEEPADGHGTVAVYIDGTLTNTPIYLQAQYIDTGTDPQDFAEIWPTRESEQVTMDQTGEIAVFDTLHANSGYYRLIIRNLEPQDTLSKVILGTSHK